MKKWTSVVVLVIILLLACSPCIADMLTDDEVIEAAKYIKELTAENESLKRQVVILQEGLETSDRLSKQVMMQVQAWTALQESRDKMADDALNRMVKALGAVEVTVDKLDKKLAKAENRADFWQSVSVVMFVASGALAADR